MKPYKTTESKSPLTEIEIEKEKSNGWNWVVSEPQIAFTVTSSGVLPGNYFKHRFERTADF